MPSEVLDSAVASIAEVRREVVVVERAALHLLLVRLHLQMAYSRFHMFLVGHFPWRKGR